MLLDDVADDMLGDNVPAECDVTSIPAVPPPTAPMAGPGRSRSGARSPCCCSCGGTVDGGVRLPLLTRCCEGAVDGGGADDARLDEVGELSSDAFVPPTPVDEAFEIFLLTFFLFLFFFLFFLPATFADETDKPDAGVCDLDRGNDDDPGVDDLLRVL